MLARYDRAGDGLVAARDFARALATWLNGIPEAKLLAYAARTERRGGRAPHGIAIDGFCALIAGGAAPHGGARARRRRGAPVAAPRRRRRLRRRLRSQLRAILSARRQRRCVQKCSAASVLLASCKPGGGNF